MNKNDTKDKYAVLYNLGCLYNKIKKPKTALAWFSRANLVSPSSLESLYAIAIILYRSQMFKLSLDFTLKCLESPFLTDISLSQSLKYLAAVNYKAIGNLKETNNFYCHLQYELDKIERKDLIKYTWGLLMVPLIKDRKKKMKHIDGLKTFIEFYDIKGEENLF